MGEKQKVQHEYIVPAYISKSRKVKFERDFIYTDRSARLGQQIRVEQLSYFKAFFV
jgi:hypothetical protein